MNDTTTNCNFCNMPASSIGWNIYFCSNCQDKHNIKVYSVANLKTYVYYKSITVVINVVENTTVFENMYPYPKCSLKLNCLLTPSNFKEKADNFILLS